MHMETTCTDERMRMRMRMCMRTVRTWIPGLTLQCLVPSEMRSVLRNGGSLFVDANTHDIACLCANACSVLKCMLVFIIFVIQDMLLC